MTDHANNSAVRRTGFRNRQPMQIEGSTTMAARTRRTLKKDKAFFDTLSETANVKAAALAAGYPRSSVYEWRDKDQAFRKSWEAAWHVGVDALEEEALRRGVEGVLEPVWHKGEVVGHARKYSDVLLMFMLKGRRPETFRDNASVQHSGHAGAPLDFTVSLVSPKNATS